MHCWPFTSVLPSAHVCSPAGAYSAQPPMDGNTCNPCQAVKKGAGMAGWNAAAKRQKRRLPCTHAALLSRGAMQSPGAAG